MFSAKTPWHNPSVGRPFDFSMLSFARRLTEKYLVANGNCFSCPMRCEIRVKVKIFGVIRTTTGFSYIETEAKTVNDIFEAISHRMRLGYEEDAEELERQKNDPNVKYIKPRSRRLIKN